MQQVLKQLGTVLLMAGALGRSIARCERPPPCESQRSRLPSKSPPRDKFMIPFLAGRSSLVLLVAHMLHPVDGFSVEALLNGEVSHPRRQCGSVPVFCTGREPDDIAGANLFNRTAGRPWLR